MGPFRCRIVPTITVVLIVFFLVTLTKLRVRLETFDLTKYPSRHHDASVVAGQKADLSPEERAQQAKGPIVLEGQDIGEDRRDHALRTGVAQSIPNDGPKASQTKETEAELSSPDWSHADEHDNYESRQLQESESELNKVNASLEMSRAYVFYAVEDAYACSVLINIRLLMQKFKTRYKIHVLVSQDVSQFYRAKMMELGAEVTEHEPPSVHPDSKHYYEGCLLKLFAFKMHHIDPTLKRVLAMDGDQMILQDLDHVFDLLSVDVAAPRIYWKDPNESSSMKVTSTFMLIEPSDRLWNQVKAKIETISANVFDMDIVNELFEPSALVLPGSYATLNSQWEDHILPPWYRGVPSPEPARNYTRLSPEELKAKKKKLTNEAWEHRDVPDYPRWVEMTTAIGDGLDKFPKGNAADEDLERVWRQAQVLHFTAVGKPWSWPTETLKLMRPHAHELLYESWKTWRTDARDLCESLVDKI